MKIAVLGTGMVGSAIGSRLIELGNEVCMGSRTQDNEKATKWRTENGSKASNDTFQEAAKFANEFVFNCTNGQQTINALTLAGAENLKGKILIDIANPLDFSKGMPPSLSICNQDSLGEEIQRTFPEVKVIKSLNTMNCNIMLNPSLVPGNHNVFVSGDSKEAKDAFIKLLETSGWESENIIDLGDITTARGTEMLLPIWIRLWGALGTAEFNFYINKK